MKSTVINGRVYCGGGVTDDNNIEYIVYCYDPSQDKWTTLSPLSVRWFGLGQVHGKVVAVGGKKKYYNTESNAVYMYEELSQKWEQTIPPMPTARNSPGVLSLQSALVVAGGSTPYPLAPYYYTAVVNISNWTHCSGAQLTHYQLLVVMYR